MIGPRFYVLNVDGTHGPTEQRHRSLPNKEANDTVTQLNTANAAKRGYLRNKEHTSHGNSSVHLDSLTLRSQTRSQRWDDGWREAQHVRVRRAAA